MLVRPDQAGILPAAGDIASRTVGMKCVPGVAAALLAVSLAACSGGGSSPSAPSVTSGSPEPLPATDTPAPPPPAPAEACDFPADRIVPVADASALSAALANATPGTRIELAPGTYGGHFTGSALATAAQPIVVCGPRTAILDGGVTDTGYVFHLDGAAYWILSGFSVTRGKNGVVLDHASHNRLTGLDVHDMGQTGVHMRYFSSDNLLDNSDIRDTGRYVPGVGEGVYIGSALRHWVDATGSSTSPDRSDRNRVIDNRIGPGVTAESIDIKEGTTGGELRGNVFDGSSLSGENGGDSWVDMKGNGYVVADNTGAHALVDGFQVHVVVEGWGAGNLFTNNVADVGGAGYGFRIPADASGNVVACDNLVQDAALGFATIACTSGAVTPPPIVAPPVETPPVPAPPVLTGALAPSQNFDLTHWYLTLPSGATVSVAELNAAYQYAGAFYTDAETGGMVFQCSNLAGTTANSHYSRSELREMRNPSNTSAKDDSNNWTTSDGGTLKATLRVDHVSTTGDADKVGRVVIGQIHGPDSEPIRLYYDKKPGEARGRIYAGHDSASDDPSFSADIVGNDGDGGIALGETFGYEIDLADVHLTVTIRLPSGALVTYRKDIDPAYRGLNLYFKAGVYNQNNTGDSADYAQATFFALTASHP